MIKKNGKPVFWFILFMISNIGLYGQSSYSDKKHELNLGYLNIFNLNTNAKFGIGYKYHFSNFAVRSALNFNFLDIQIDDISKDFFRYDIKVGVESQKDIDKLQFFYGMDLFYSKIYDSNSSHYYFDNHYVEYKNLYEFGACPLIGLKFIINKRFSVSTEECLNFIIRKGIAENTYTQTDETIVTKISQTIINLSPAGILTLNIHL